jgi:hypothetical protein
MDEVYLYVPSHTYVLTGCQRQRRKSPGFDPFKVWYGGWDLAESLERLAVNVNVVTVPGSIPLKYGMVDEI